MYRTYLNGFRLLYALGFKQSSVRLARVLHERSDFPLQNTPVSEACWSFMHQYASFPICAGDYFSCGFPVLSKNDSFHDKCREARAEDDLRIAELLRLENEAWVAAEAEAENFLKTRCNYPGCWEEGVIEDYCLEDWKRTFFCAEPGCEKLYTDCYGSCVETHDEEDDDQEDEPYDMDDESDNECQDGCGQPDYACTCAELESYRRFQADPATAGSFWTA